MWPHVKNLLLSRLKEIQNSHKDGSQGIVVVEAAVLLDADWDSNGLFDGIWIIRSSSETSAQRLVEKRGMSRQDALQRMETQLTRRGIGNCEDELKDGTVTAVIDNDHDNDHGEDNDGPDLWEKMRLCLLDPTCWKESRCPPITEVETSPNVNDDD